MRKAIGIALTVVVLLTSPCIALARDKTVRIYDENSHFRGTIQNGRFYDENSCFRGTIQKGRGNDRVYDDKSHFRGTIQRDQNKSRSHHEREEDEEE